VALPTSYYLNNNNKKKKKKSKADWHVTPAK
jgi:hypothetical protein